MELDLETLTPLSGDLYHYPEPWDLNDGLPEGLGDGLRSVYVKLENALGIQGKAESVALTLDTTTPSLSLVISPEQAAYAPGATVELLISANEARDGEPTLTLAGEPLSLKANQSGAYPITLPMRRG